MNTIEIKCELIQDKVIKGERKVTLRLIFISEEALTKKVVNIFKDDIINMLKKDFNIRL